MWVGCQSILTLSAGAAVPFAHPVGQLLWCELLLGGWQLHFICWLLIFVPLYLFLQSLNKSPHWVQGAPLHSDSSPFTGGGMWGSFCGILGMSHLISLEYDSLYDILLLQLICIYNIEEVEYHQYVHILRISSVIFLGYHKTTPTFHQGAPSHLFSREQRSGTPTALLVSNYVCTTCIKLCLRLGRLLCTWP